MRLYESLQDETISIEAIDGFKPDKVSIFDGAATLVGEFDTEAAEGKAFASIGALPYYDRYTAVWHDGASGKSMRRCFDYAQAPYFDSEQMMHELEATKMALGSRITPELISEKREQVEDAFDSIAGRAFCLRGARQRIVSDGGAAFFLEKAYAQDVVSASIDGVPVAEGSCSVFGLGLLRFRGEVPRGSVIEVHYTHGEAVQGADLARYAMMLCRTIVVPSEVNPRAVGEQGEYGFIRYTVAGKDGATGIPEIDAFLGSNHQKGGQGVNRIFVL